MDHLYMKIKEEIAYRIKGGVYKQGDRLPSEAEIVDEFAVSRNTARRALDELELEGLAKRIQGKGSFVFFHKINQRLAELKSLSELFESQNRKSSSKVLSLSVVPPTASVRFQLGLSADEKAIRIYRLRYADFEPAILNEVYLSASRFSFLLDLDLEIISIYDFLEKKKNIFATRAEETLDIVKLDREQAKLLRQKPESPAFLLKCLTYENTGKPFEWIRSIYRSDLFSFSVTLER